MSDQSQTPMENPTIRFEIVPEDEQQQDLGDVAEVAQNMIDYLTKNGCTVTPTYTGKMGGGPVYDVLIQTYHVIHSNEELLAAMFASLAATLKLISDRKNPSTSEKPILIPTPEPVEVDLPTKDGPIIIKAPNAEAAMKMVEQFQNTQPGKLKKVNPNNQPGIKVTIPKQKWHRQH